MVAAHRGFGHSARWLEHRGSARRSWAARDRHGKTDSALGCSLAVVPDAGSRRPSAGHGESGVYDTTTVGRSIAPERRRCGRPRGAVGRDGSGEEGLRRSTGASVGRKLGHGGAAVVVFSWSRVRRRLAVANG
ncbi:uncharacterized protein M6B38_413670 [Iris pallida]|uniref:Uncharacterized protein n=1 Tax=Iris pallida TaxID=29817 RepID=A0AAX6FLF9_IRIPA|nr:uncharacterized protein M6B38_413670 [Iris pallida]